MKTINKKKYYHFYFVCLKKSCVGMAKKYFRLIARAVPHGRVIRGNNADEEDCYTEFMPGELKALEVVGMPVRLEHNDKTLVGHVVEKIMSPLDAMLVRIEIPFNEDLDTLRGRRRHQGKLNVVHMIEEGYLADVSLTHYFIEDESKDKRMVMIKKRPVEISLVVEGERSGSSIISSSEWADKPFLNENEYKQFAPENSKCASVIDFLPEEPFEVSEPQETKPKEKEKEKEFEVGTKKEEEDDNETQGTMADKREYISKDDFEALMKTNTQLKESVEKLRQEKEELEPLATKYKEAMSERDKELKTNFKRKFSSLFDVTDELLNEDKEGKQDEAEKKTIQDELELLRSDKQEVMGFLDTFLGEKQGDPARIEAYEKMDGLLGKAAPTMVKCSQYLSNKKKQIEQERKELNKARAEMASQAHSNMVSEPPKGKAPAHRDTSSWIASFQNKTNKMVKESKSFAQPDSMNTGW